MRTFDYTAAFTDSDPWPDLAGGRPAANQTLLNCGSRGGIRYDTIVGI